MCSEYEKKSEEADGGVVDGVMQKVLLYIFGVDFLPVLLRSLSIDSHMTSQ